MIIENLRKYLKFVQNLWMGIDFLGESGRWPARGSQAGLLNLREFDVRIIVRLRSLTEIKRIKD